MICSINLHILFTWQQTTGAERAVTTLCEAGAPSGPALSPPAATGVPPPARPQIRTAT